MPPTSEVRSFGKLQAERKVSIRYVDVNGHQREKQMPFAEFQSFCVAWCAEEYESRHLDDHKPMLTDLAPD